MYIDLAIYCPAIPTASEHESPNEDHVVFAQAHFHKHRMLLFKTKEEQNKTRRAPGCSESAVHSLAAWHLQDQEA
jgi:hypothetical protein